MRNYTTIPTTQLAAETAYQQTTADNEVIHLDDPAISAMTDFSKTRAFTIGPESPLLEASTEMRVCQTHMLLVTDTEENVIGMISSEDILGKKPLQVSVERKIRRSDILVRMVMDPYTAITCIDIQELAIAKVGDIVETLHSLKQHYALVLDSTNKKKQKILGVFSLWDMSERAGVNLT